MADNTYISLDTTGYIDDPNAKAERILATYLGTNNSQSFLFNGKLFSLSNTLRRYANRIDDTARAVEQDLSDLFQKYFNTVQAEVTTVGKTLADGSTSSAVYTLQVKVTFTSSSGTYNLARALNVSHDRITSIATLDFNA